MPTHKGIDDALVAGAAIEVLSGLDAVEFVWTWYGTSDNQRLSSLTRCLRGCGRISTRTRRKHFLRIARCSTAQCD